MESIAKVLLGFKTFEDFKHIDVFSFQAGYVAGVGVFVALAILFSLAYWFIFRYPRRSAGISIRGQLGSIFISSHAISDLVKSLEGDFKDIEIAKVLLLDCKKFNRIEIQVNYELGGQSMTDIAPALQGRTVEALKDVFGIECIRDVSVRVRRAERQQSPF